MNNILGGETVMARFWSDLVSSFKCYLKEIGVADEN